MVGAGRRGSKMGMRPAVGLLLLALVFFAPLPFGAVQPGWVGTLEALVFLLFCVLLLRRARRGGMVRLPLARTALLFAGLHLLQLIPLPGPLVGLLSPTAHTLYRQLLPDSAASTLETLSLAPDLTMASLVRFCGGLAAFWLARLAAGSPGTDGSSDRFVLGIPARGRAGQAGLALCMTIGGAGLVQALWGIPEHLLGWDRIFFYSRRFPMDGVAGTFVNTNHCAAYLAMALSVTVALILHIRRQRTKPNASTGTEAIASITPYRPHPLLLPLFASAAGLMLAALLLTRSGGGIIAATVGLVFFTVIFISRGSKRNTRQTAAVMVLVLIAGLAALSLLLPQDVEPSVLTAETTSDVANRLTIWRQALVIVGEFPLCGSGAGTCGLLMRHYTNRMVVHAHNEYLELLCDLGPAGLACTLPLLALALRLLTTARARPGAGGTNRRIRPRRYPRDRILPLGVSTALAALAVHALVDFPLRIPAIALTAAGLLGLLSRYPGEGEEPHRFPVVTVRWWLPFSISALLLGLSLVRLAGLAIEDSTGWQAHCRQAQAAVEGLEDPAAARDAVGRCIAARPLELRGHALALELARREGDEAGITRALDRCAIARPADPGVAFSRGAHLLESGRAAEGLAEFRRSLELGSDHLDEIFETCMTIFSNRFPLFARAFPVTPKILERLGDRLARAGLTGEALDQYRRSLALGTERAELHFKISRILRRSGDRAGALAAVETALHLDGSERDQWVYYKGEDLLLLGETGPAFDLARTLVSRSPIFEGGYALLARIHAARGEPWEAIRVCREAIWRVRDNGRLHRLMGDRYRELQQTGRALESYIAAADTPFNSYEEKLALHRAALCAEQLGRLEEARTLAGRARQLADSGTSHLDGLVVETLERLKAVRRHGATGQSGNER